MHSINGKVGQRIAMLRFLMIFGIVMLHTPQYVALTDTAPGAFNFFKAMIQHAVFRNTVPVLTGISGYLLFSSGLDRAWKDLAAKKCKTLVIPFLTFNFGLLGAMYLLQLRTGTVMAYDLQAANLQEWLDASLGLTTSPINYPLNFLRDLLALMLLAPAIGVALRRFPVLGLAAMLAVFSFNLDGLFLLRNQMAVMFYLGGMAAVQRWNLLALDKWAPLALLAFVVISIATVALQITNRTYLGYVVPLLIWVASALIVNTRVGVWMGKMSKYSFFIFVAHAPLLGASWLVYQKVATHVPYAVYWFATPVVTATVLIGVYHVAMRYCGPAFSFVLGIKPKAAISSVGRKLGEAVERPPETTLSA